MLVNVLRAIIILLLISFSDLPSSVIKLPRYTLSITKFWMSLDPVKNNAGKLPLDVSTVGYVSGHEMAKETEKFRLFHHPSVPRGLYIISH